VRDLMTVMWKELAEFVGNTRSLRVFGVAVVLLGLLPLLSGHGLGTGATAELRLLIAMYYVLFATLLVVANTAPDLVLHERVGRTLDYLLTTRLPDWAIFGGKVLTATCVGYAAAVVAIALQLLFTAALGGHGWTWLYLAVPAGRILTLALPAVLSLYLSVVGTFVALRVGDQRSAYLVTVLAIGVVLAPLLLGWIPVQFTPAWLVKAAAAWAVLALALAAAGLRLFRRQMLVLYLQE